MNSKPTELLLLRIDALERDVEKVKAAVKRAEARGQFVRQALERMELSKSNLVSVSDALRSLAEGMKRDSAIVTAVDGYSSNLAGNLRDAPGRLESSVDALYGAINALKQAKRLSVTLSKERRQVLDLNLQIRCKQLTTKLGTLRKKIESTGDAQRRDQWAEFENLQETSARPLFMDYVDFLAGLTVRDMGLDDEVCDMTEHLLRRYTVVINRSLPLPARQAALGNVLQSVVLLGFPEWSIWGIPLVGHEVGMAYLRNRTDSDLLELADKYVRRLHDAGQEAGAGCVHHLIADAFGTYTLGLSYAAAALLLRLNPRHDEPRVREQPRDIDRARVIRLTLTGPTALDGGGDYSDAVGLLTPIWENALRSYAGPDQADQAVEEMAGSPREKDWIDDLTADVIDHFSGIMPNLGYNDERWRGSGKWMEPLKKGDPGPDWPYEDDITDLLTAAWRLRLANQDPPDLSERIKCRWATRQVEDRA